MAKGAARTILFLGVGNHDRSRVAEILFNSVAGKMGLPWTAVSKGIEAKVPTKKEGPMAVASSKTLQARGLRGPAFDRPPEQVTEADFEAADRVIGLDRTELAPALENRFPAWAGKVEYWNVAPGAETVAVVDREVTNLVARLLGGSVSEDVPVVPEPAPAGRAARPETVKIGRETKGRRGKGVTLLSEVPLEEGALLELAALLKGRCGTGGTVKDGVIEIQGDQRDRLTAEMEKLGYRVKRVGG